MLTAERSLVTTAEELAQLKSHGVNSKHIDVALTKANDDLKSKSNSSLSEGQVQAISHLVGEGQIKCVVGIAGAGKTTALGICHEIWKAEGYAVYGLAPTGKAAQNLDQNGIPSTTLHKFLKSFESGRCQYGKNSVLVLDEAGMVDVGRFSSLLNAVKQLGVKLIVVGDGAQLQPVEAGPAFRLVTARVGKTELNTVLRQNTEWQREATVLFGEQKTSAAIQKYVDRGCVHIVEEKLPSLKDIIQNEGSRKTKLNDPEGLIRVYEISARLSALVYREMIGDVRTELDQESKYSDHSSSSQLHVLVRQHQDYARYKQWENLEKEAAQHILQHSDQCRPALESRYVDTLKIAMLFVDKSQPLPIQEEKAKAILKDYHLDYLSGIEKPRGFTVDVRQDTKEAMVNTWYASFKETFTKETIEPLSNESLLFAYSNRDVNHLNTLVRSLLKESGHISKDEFTFTIKKEIDDDFGGKQIIQEEKSFSKGDQILFTRNTHSLNVKNGTMGTITSLNSQKIQVKLDEGRDISFAPNLNPYFDQGWAITIHKSQGTDTKDVYLLASYEMNQNLAYVGMTRHKDGLKVFGSSLDFWRSEKLPEVLSKSGEKLSAADYLDTDSLTKLMQKEDQILAKIFNRISNELEAMGAVSKKIFWNVADHFLGIKREEEMRINSDSSSRESIREEVRAEELLKPTPQQKTTTVDEKPISPALQAVYEDWKHPAFNAADFYKRVFTKGLETHGEAASIEYWKSKREPYMQMYEQKIEKVEHELHSPLLSTLSDKAKGLARTAAHGDPDKALKFLADLQRIKKAEQDAQAQALQAKEAALKWQEEQDRTRHEGFKNGLSNYFRFKDISHELERREDYDLEKERSAIGKSLYKNKEVLEHIEKIDPEISKAIQQVAQEKQLQKMKERDWGMSM